MRSRLTPCVFDATGRLCGMVSYRGVHRWKARTLHLPVKTRYCRSRLDAVEWILSESASRCLPMEVPQ